MIAVPADGFVVMADTPAKAVQASAATSTAATATPVDLAIAIGSALAFASIVPDAQRRCVSAADTALQLGRVVDRAPAVVVPIVLQLLPLKSASGRQKRKNKMENDYCNGLSPHTTVMRTESIMVL